MRTLGNSSRSAHHRASARTFAAIFFAVSAVVTLSSPAEAATSWSTGTQISALPGWKSGYPAVEGWIEGCSSSTGPVATVGKVKLAGDYLYVRDECRDGRSAILEWRTVKDTSRRWICRNSKGYGTVVRCNFDWPETNGILIPGVSQGTSSIQRDHGNSIWLTQSGDDITLPPPV